MENDEKRQEVLSFMRERELQYQHVSHVTRLALELFDGLSALHGLGERERLWLEAAGYLHDIGHFADSINVSHHKESARLIRELPWAKFSPAEVNVIAQVARYHRKAVPKLKHPEFLALTETEQEIVKKLAALLRLADSLDRNHDGSVTGLRVEWLADRIIIRLDATGPVLREVFTAYKKGDLAQEVFQRALVFKVGDEVIQPEFPVSS